MLRDLPRTRAARPRRAAVTSHDRSSFLSEFEWRGLLLQTTAEELRPLLAAERTTAYIGFDPTAASLHVGSLLQVLALMRFQRAGHRPIAVVGGGTGLIGDPSGKASERPLLTTEKLAENLAGIRAQLERFLDFSGSDGAVMVDNAEWLCRLNLVEFLRDVGKHFSINAMVQRDAVKLRVESREQGMSYTEFSYALLQAYDFLELHDRLGCRLQMGGSDQWGNIVDGCDLVRRLRGSQVFGLIQPLVTKSDGSKFGKSESGNVWLDPELTSPFAFYQFWLNVDDQDVKRYLRFFTFFDRAMVEMLDIEVERNAAAREAQKKLAEHVTRMVHGDSGYDEARRATDALFGGGELRALSGVELRRALDGLPRTKLGRAQLGTDAASLAALVAQSGLAPSKGQARTMLTSGSIRLNGAKVDDASRVVDSKDVLAGDLLVLRRGAKSYAVVEVSD
jgi:tyrosyl-tRNA synthetase